MNIEIDPYAGFCFGVAKAIEEAENNLADGQDLFCLGEIVHNEEETDRLAELGLRPIDEERYRTMKDTRVLIRAHGEPPETYAYADSNNIKLIEATCPVVLKLQQKVRKAWEEMRACGGAVVIAGKRQHPEVIGLAGQTSGEAVIIESADELERVRFDKPIRLFAQTTFDSLEFERITEHLKKLVTHKQVIKGDLKVHNTICGQVSNRIPKLKSFCEKHDVVIFVSGRNSSNGKNLFKICRATNPESYHVGNPGELEHGWFASAKSIGVSGATSTPRWLMENVAAQIIKIRNVS